MKIRYIVWLDYIKDKLQRKHHIAVEEVEQVFHNEPRFFKKEKGRVQREHVYNALGKTDAGRYLSVFFIYKKNANALIMSARDMNMKERTHYAKK